MKGLPSLSDIPSTPSPGCRWLHVAAVFLIYKRRGQCYLISLSPGISAPAPLQLPLLQLFQHHLLCPLTFIQSLTWYQPGVLRCLGAPPCWSSLETTIQDDPRAVHEKTEDLGFTIISTENKLISKKHLCPHVPPHAITSFKNSSL